MNDILLVARDFGLPTFLLLAAALYMQRKEKAWEKERQDLYRGLVEETRARNADAKEHNSKLIEFQSQLISAINALREVSGTRELQRELLNSINKLSDAVEAWEKRDERDLRTTGQRGPRRDAE